MTSIKGDFQAQFNQMPSELIHQIQNELTKIYTAEAVKGLFSLGLGCKNMKDHLDDQGRLQDIKLRKRILDNLTSLDEDLAHSIKDNHSLLNQTAEHKICQNIIGLKYNAEEFFKCCTHKNPIIRKCATDTFFMEFKRHLTHDLKSIENLIFKLYYPAREIQQKTKALLLDWFNNDRVHLLDHNYRFIDVLADEELIRAYSNSCVRQLSNPLHDGQIRPSNYFCDLIPNEEIRDAARTQLIRLLDSDKLNFDNESALSLTQHDHPNIKSAALRRLNRLLEPQNSFGLVKYKLTCLKDDSFLNSQYLYIRKASFEHQLNELKEQNKIDQLLLDEKYSQHANADIRNYSLDSFIQLIGTKYLPISSANIQNYYPHPKPEVESKAINVFLNSKGGSLHQLMQDLPHPSAQVQEAIIKHILQHYPSAFSIENLLEHQDASVSKAAQKYTIQYIETGKLDEFIESDHFLSLKNDSIQNTIIDRIAGQLCDGLRPFTSFNLQSIQSRQHENIYIHVMQTAQNRAHDLIQHDLALQTRSNTQPTLTQLEAISNDETLDELTQYKAAVIIRRNIENKNLDHHIWDTARFLDNQHHEVRIAATQRALELIQNMTSSHLKQLIQSSSDLHRNNQDGLITLLKNATQIRYSQNQQDYHYFELPSQSKVLIDALDTVLQESILNGNLDDYVSDFNERNILSPLVLQKAIEQRLKSLIRNKFTLEQLLNPYLLEHSSEQVKMHTFYELTQILETKTSFQDLFGTLSHNRIWHIQDQTLQLTLMNKLQAFVHNKKISKEQLSMLKTRIPEEHPANRIINDEIKKHSGMGFVIKKSIKSSTRIFKK